MPRWCQGCGGSRYRREQVGTQKQVWGYPLLIRASSDTGRHLNLSASGTRRLEVGPAPVYPISFHSGRFEWVLHWAPSCIASLSHLIVPSIVPAWAMWGGGGEMFAGPLREGERGRERDKPVTVSIASQSSAISL